VVQIETIEIDKNFLCLSTKNRPRVYNPLFLVYCDRSKSMKNAQEAAQIFVSGTRCVLIDTTRSEDQKCAAKLTPADSYFLSGRSIIK
jgi:hypothetical protein